MGKAAVIWGRDLGCVLAVLALSACNQEGIQADPVGLQQPAVEIDPPQQQAINVAPQIVGSPRGEVPVGNAYSFVPSASDANGDRLTFSIAGKPGWAYFNKFTGRLGGIPTAADVGSYEEISISVSDGKSSQTLPQFAINVVQQSNGSATLAWQPPTENTDGSPLTNLSGYRIHYGTQPGHYDSTITVNNAGVTRYVIENLAPGTYFFAITAVSGAGAESDPSGEASKTI